MQVRVRNDSVEITGYINAIERNSKPLRSRIGRFVERVCKGAFSKALERNSDVKLLLNHQTNRELGSTTAGNLELKEDNIGLFGRAVVTDPEVIEDARSGRLVGWSFGFYDVEGGVDQSVDEETHLPLRKLRDLDLREVSILNNKKSPAYEGTLVCVRDDNTMVFISDPDDEVEIREEDKKPVDYTAYEKMIEDMKEGK